MAKDVSIESDGLVNVSEVAGPKMNGVDQVTSWRARPDQAAKMLATWTDPTRKLADGVTGSAPISAGDVSAIQDAASEYAKQAKS